MAEDLIRYDILAQDALRGVLRKVLSEVAKTGLPGEHHFYLTFATKSPGVRISSRLVNQYPEEMTIVLQHQYWDLTVTEQSVEVGLSFNGVPERLLVPFTAIKAFVDPSVQFALQFEPAIAEVESIADAEASDDEDAPTAKIVSGPKTAEPKTKTNAAKKTSKGESDAGKEAKEEEDSAPQAEVVSLDTFRKKS